LDLRAWCACLRGREFSWRWILGSGCSFLLLLAEDYNLAATDRTTEAQRHRDSLGSNSRRSPALRSLRATGSSARQPLDHDRCRCPWFRLLLVAAALGQGRPGLPPSSGRAGLPGKRSCLGGRRQVGPEGLVCLPPVGEFSWRWILGNDRSFLLLLAKNYNLAATDRTTEAQRHRDSFGAIPSVLQPCGPQAAAPGQPQGRDCCQRSCPGRCSWPPPMGRAVRAWQTGGT
jgi:hypothetical protein